MDKPVRQTTSYKEALIGNTLYRVTSVFTGEKDLGRTLEELAIRRAMAELAPDAAQQQKNIQKNVFISNLFP